MLLLIGPAEEIFWRGYVQRTLSKRWNPNAGFVVATLIYALVHAGSCNFMLVMAALVVGAAWGALLLFFSEPLCRYYLVSCSVGCGGIYIFPRYDYCLQKNKVAVMIVYRALFSRIMNSFQYTTGR